MSYLLQAVQWRCDWCGLMSEQVPLAASGIAVASRMPEGWRGIGYGTIDLAPEHRIRMTDPFGTAITNLCPACSMRPVGDLLTYLGTMPEAAPVT